MSQWSIRSPKQRAYLTYRSGGQSRVPFSPYKYQRRLEPQIVLTRFLGYKICSEAFGREIWFSRDLNRSSLSPKVSLFFFFFSLFVSCSRLSFSSIWRFLYRFTVVCFVKSPTKLDFFYGFRFRFADFEPFTPYFNWICDSVDEMRF